MHTQVVRFTFVLLAFMFVCNSLLAQRLAPDTLQPVGYQNAIATYNENLLEELHLYNGTEDKLYTRSFASGTPYFVTANWSPGTVRYNGKTYEKVSLVYDVVKDEVSLLYFNKISRIQLDKKRIEAFSLLGHNFIQIVPDTVRNAGLAAGFYDELYHGKISLLGKHTKNIQSNLRQSAEEFVVYSRDYYYIKKGQEYYPVSNKRSFLHTLADKRKELQRYIRQNKLNFKKDKENAMTKTIAYYDQLITTK